MKSYKKETGRNVNESLKRHSKYTVAVDVLRERLADCMLDSEVGFWSI